MLDAFDILKKQSHDNVILIKYVYKRKGSNDEESCSTMFYEHDNIDLSSIKIYQNNVNITDYVETLKREVESLKLEAESLKQEIKSQKNILMLSYILDKI
jgi:hypothetical protein